MYLITIAFGLFGEIFVRSKIIVWGDPAATADRILASESLWRFSIAAELFYLLCAVVLAVIYFVLLRPVSRDLALLAVSFNLVSIAIESAGMLHLISASTVLRNAERFTVFSPDQVPTMAYPSLQLHGRAFAISLLFFGCVCVVLGILIFRSRYLPRFVGVLMQIAGLAYLLDSFALILSPAFHAKIFPASLMPAFVAESSLCLWLLVRGVNVEEWHLRASTQPAQIAAGSAERRG